MADLSVAKLLTGPAGMGHRGAQQGGNVPSVPVGSGQTLAFWGATA